MSRLMDDPMILRSIIMDHYEYPRNHELTEKEDYKKSTWRVSPVLMIFMCRQKSKMV